MDKSRKSEGDFKGLMKELMKEDSDGFKDLL